MIEIKNVSKRFDKIQALSGIDLTIRDGEIFGMVGSNGAGKSTLLRILSGVIKADEGTARLDEQEIFENPAVKSDIFYISDNQYFLSNATAVDMLKFYMSLYPKMDDLQFLHLMDHFGLEKNRRINTFSKGMKKQLSMILGISAHTRYLLCDESFDGLDPIAKQAVKSLLRDAIKKRALTPVIASHNLRELEDLCDHVGLLHKGGVILSRDLGNLQLETKKIQAVFPFDVSEEDFAPLSVLRLEKVHSFCTVVFGGCDEKTLHTKIQTLNPIFYKMIPLTLEEVFITESEVAGYDISNIL